MRQMGVMICKRVDEYTLPEGGSRIAQGEAQRNPGIEQTKTPRPGGPLEPALMNDALKSMNYYYLPYGTHLLFFTLSLRFLDL